MQFHAPGTSLDGAIYYYLMNGMTTIGGGWLNGNPINLPNFTVVGTADINQDGHPDILMQFHAPGTSQDGAIYYYLLSGTAVAGGGWLNGSPINLPNFTVVGSADFNADGKPDVLMQYQAPGTSLDGALYVYLLNGPNVAGGDWLGGAPVAMPGYRVAGLGDLNGDGKADLLFQYRSPGSPYDGAPAYCIINGMTTTCF
jgi:hypothetical protein